MKIAFFSPVPFSKKLGATKNRIEMAEALSALGWETFLVGNEELGLPKNIIADRPTYCEKLKSYLIANAHWFDVVIYEYDTLPYDRNLFAKNTLLVARPALLHYHFLNVQIRYDLKTTISEYITAVKVFLGLKKKASIAAQEIIFRKSLIECDIIQVQNAKDKEELIAKYYDGNKIIIVPNGISNERLNLFNHLNRKYDGSYKIAFVGSFDYRKGAMDFPFIISSILRSYPDCKFKLIGTNGVFDTKEKLLRFFPAKLRSVLEVIHTFEPLELPGLLEDCHVGIYPTYIESFGFGALEMMAAGLPVISYAAPGPADFILPDLLVPIGNKQIFAEKVIQVLNNKNSLSLMAKQARQIAETYSWNTVAANTAKVYKALQHQAINSN